MIRAVLFDMDGLIVDTERLHFEAFRRHLREHGIELSPEVMRDLIGYTERDNLRDLKKRYRIEASLEELVARRREIYLQLIQTEPMVALPGFWECSAQARQRGLKQAVVSSAPGEQVEVVLRRLFEARPELAAPQHYFDAIITGNDITRNKPEPDIYLLAAKGLGLSPSECLVFEDSPPGVRSAAAAGMTVIAVLNEFSKGLEFPEARAVIASLSDGLRYLDS